MPTLRGSADARLPLRGMPCQTRDSKDRKAPPPPLRPRIQEACQTCTGHGCGVLAMWRRATCQRPMDRRPRHTCGYQQPVACSPSVMQLQQGQQNAPRTPTIASIACKPPARPQRANQGIARRTAQHSKRANNRPNPAQRCQTTATTATMHNDHRANQTTIQ